MKLKDDLMKEYLHYQENILYASKRRLEQFKLSLSMQKEVNSILASKQDFDTDTRNILTPYLGEDRIPNENYLLFPLALSCAEQSFQMRDNEKK